ncbi:sodium- and chloride-dependent betaine transporter-like [Cyclopterus lumpus]|uniref:sodium- and chloride-dependent betaine transporter-like n=1 Tax=Cyclopterus lumpus TaxID=8103 RepID=UPI0014870FF7|nr:sodium- and chloride-dependent betaine transporter-like [Cyclopterus lumpus]
MVPSLVPDLEMNGQRRKNEIQKRAADRGQWASKTEYMLAVAGNVVGLGNVWRFPYLCYKNGGGAFLVPYGLLSVVLGVPMFLLESSVGQYTQEGFVTCWRKLCPLAQGIGCAQLVTRMYDFSYILIQVWALFYLVFSFRAQLPWASCENTWNTANCVDSSSSNLTVNLQKNTTSAASEFWEPKDSISVTAQESVTADLAVESGPGLAFIAYPQATAMMPFPQLWNVCFFLMLILLSVDTHFVTVECFITTISDLFPKLFHKPGRHELLVLFVCSSFFLVHLLLVTEGGIYLFQLIDYYGITRACHYFMALSECLALAWIFGADRLINIIEDMTGQRPSVFFKLCWKYIIPLLSLISLIMYLVDYKHLSINDWYTYPDWAYALGWAMTLSSVLMVPLWAAGQMCVTAGTFRQRLFVLCRPTEDLDRQERDLEDEGTTVELRTSAATT